MNPVDHSPRHVISYTVGVYVAVNAWRDLFLLVDGPDCCFMRTQYVQGNHDYLSTLTSVSGLHRASHTGLEPPGVTLSRELDLVERLSTIAAHPEVGGVLLTSMPLAAVLGIDHDRLCREAARRAGKVVLDVPGRSLSDDWLGGYAETLRALAGGLQLGPREPLPGHVAVVGLLFDRNEEDCLGDVRELRRLLTRVGLTVDAVWPEGLCLDELGATRHAQTIISLPYGRRAARLLARRLGAELVEAELPFGLPATERFLRHVGSATGRGAAAERVIEEELAQVIPKLECVVPALIQGKRFAYLGDPHMLSGFREMIELCGGAVATVVVTDFAHHLVESPGDAGEAVLVEPRQEELLRFLERQVKDQQIDAVVSSSLCSDAAALRGKALLELGFPSNNNHALHDRPRLGFRGVLCFVEQLTNVMRAHLSGQDLMGGG